MPRAVLFDMDGLLVDTEPIWFEAESAVMARLGGGWTPDDQRVLIGGSLRSTVGYLISRAASPDLVPGFDAVADWLISGMAALLATRPVEPLPGAIELITAVRSAGLPYALVTSSERVIADAVLAALARHGIEFDVTVCGADVRNPKPHPEPYQLAASLTGASPSHCVALEDSPNGIASALAAGCATVAVPGPLAVAARPGLLIADSLADIDLDVLRGLISPDSRGTGRTSCEVSGPPRRRGPAGLSPSP